MTKKKGLGRGLGALIADSGSDAPAAGTALEVPIEAVTANPLQPRTNFRASEMKKLADSIKDKGVIEPLVVRRIGDGQYELIAGERRLRASREARLKTVPVLLKEAEPLERLELALIENIHREDLNPMEEAEAYLRLQEEFNRTTEDISRLVGRDRSTVANTLRLLGLPSPVQDDVRQGRLTAGHARALLALNDADRIEDIRREVLTRSLSVRETEALVKRKLGPKRPRAAEGRKDGAYFQALSESMSRALGSKVKVSRRGKRGRVEIAFSSNEELERLLARFGIGPV